MSYVRLTAVLVLCLIAPAVARAADGSVNVYLQPLPAEAARLTFAIASVSAVAAGGSESPLKVSLKTAGGTETTRQRLLASGRLQPGSYSGFVLRVQQAALQGPHGEQKLTVPDAPIRLDASFAVGGSQGALFWLALRYQESIGGENAFTPVFTLVTPPGPIPDHAGLVTNTASNTITVFDKSLAQAVAVIDTCGGPAGLALDQRRRRAYVACSKDDQVQAIDVATGAIVERSGLSPGDRPREVALTPDGNTLVSVNNGSNSISFFDATSLTRQERINVGSGPSSILIDPSGRRAFVFNTLSSSVSVVDLASRNLLATTSTESSPLRGAFNARGDRLYVIHERSPYMTVLDPQQLTIVTRARLRIGVTAIDVDRVRDLICLGGSRDTAVEFYDPNALMPIYSMRTKAGVDYLRIDAENNALYMVSREARGLLVGRLAGRQVVAQIDVGDDPYCVAVMGEK